MEIIDPIQPNFKELLKQKPHSIEYDSDVVNLVRKCRDEIGLNDYEVEMPNFGKFESFHVGSLQLVKRFRKWFFRINVKIALTKELEGSIKFNSKNHNHHFVIDNK